VPGEELSRPLSQNNLYCKRFRIGFTQSHTHVPRKENCMFNGINNNIKTYFGRKI